MLGIIDIDQSKSTIYLNKVGFLLTNYILELVLYLAEPNHLLVYGKLAR